MCENDIFIHVGGLGVVGESLQVTQDTWSKTVGVRWCAQERVHSCVVCGRRRGRLRLARCRVCCAPRHRAPRCGAHGIGRRPGCQLPAHRPPAARYAIWAAALAAGAVEGGVFCVQRAAHRPTCICVVQCLSHTSHSRCWRTLGGISFVICDTVMHAVI